MQLLTWFCYKQKKKTPNTGVKCTVWQAHMWATRCENWHQLCHTLSHLIYLLSLRKRTVWHALQTPWALQHLKGTLSITVINICTNKLQKLHPFQHSTSNEDILQGSQSFFSCWALGATLLWTWLQHSCLSKLDRRRHRDPTTRVSFLELKGKTNSKHGTHPSRSNRRDVTTFQLWWKTLGRIIAP